MKKKMLFGLLGAGVLLTMNACKSELDLDKELTFSKLTVEEQKQKIEQNGIDFIDAMQGMENTAAMKAIAYVADLSGSEAYNAPLLQLSADIQKSNKSTFTNFDRQMRVSYVDSEVWGEYSYNSQTNEMEKVAGLSNKLIIKFPASASSTANNAVITITYAESNVKAPDTDEYYPSEITFVMKVDSKEVMSADFSGSYYSDGTPKSAEQNLEIEDFKYTAKIKNDHKTMSESYELKKGSKTLLRSLAELKGNLVQSTLENAIENDTPEDAISEFAVFFQVMDVAVKGGTTDFKGFVAEAKALNDNDENLDTKEEMQKRADIINKYLVCTAYFEDDNRKFADVEFFVNEFENTEYVYNETTYTSEFKTYTDYELKPRFILSDGSKVEIEEYAQEGFDDFIKKLEAEME